MTFAARGVTVELGGRVVLQDVTLELDPGSVVAVVGGDGAGKSTLLRCFVGEARPARGSVTRPDQRDVGYMPSTSGTWRDLTVDENLAFVARVFGVTGATFDERRDRRLAQAGLTEARDRLVRDLSGGMRQKLGFCLAMIHDPALLVLDEPTTGVDPVSRVDLWRMIAGAAARGAAVVMATTYLDEAERASSVLVLDEGVPLLSGPPHHVIATAGPVEAVVHPRDAAQAWRRGRAFHQRGGVDPPGEDPARVAPDLEDVVIAAMLDRRHGGRG
jgi:ABC-2 type transport system ATP-binding protein